MNRFETQKRIKLRYLFLIAATLLWAWQWHEYTKSLDSIEETLAEVKYNLSHLEQSINDLQTAMNKRTK